MSKTIMEKMAEKRNEEQREWNELPTSKYGIVRLSPRRWAVIKQSGQVRHNNEPYKQNSFERVVSDDLTFQQACLDLYELQANEFPPKK
jgi:hypothetical protein